MLSCAAVCQYQLSLLPPLQYQLFLLPFLPQYQLFLLPPLQFCPLYMPCFLMPTTSRSALYHFRDASNQEDFTIQFSALIFSSCIMLCMRYFTSNGSLTGLYAVSPVMDPSILTLSILVQMPSTMRWLPLFEARSMTFLPYHALYLGTATVVVRNEWAGMMR